MKEKMVITCAVTGAETTRSQNPALPITPEEIAESTYQAFKAGAAIVHLHVRDKDGNPTQDTSVFSEVISLIRKKCNIVIEITTGGSVGMTVKERLEPVKLKPEMASLDCGSVNFGDEYLLNPLPVLRRFALEMKKYNVKPTLECFDLSHIYNAIILIKENLLTPPFHFSFIMNTPGGIPYSCKTLSFLIDQLPEHSYWTLMGIGGRASLSSHFGAIALGGFIRAGFEDNVYYSKGILAKSNSQLIERAILLANEAGLDVATPDDVRKIFKL